MRSFSELTKERTYTMRIFPRLRVFLLVLNGTAILMIGHVSEAQDRSQGRSMVISRNGIVAAESPLAAQAGAGILERGGNAVGGAIAADALVGGVEPMMNCGGVGVFPDLCRCQGQQHSAFEMSV